MAIYLGLGTNIGDRAKNLNDALESLEGHPKISIKRASNFYETPPWGDTNQPSFLNAAVEVKTSLKPHELLAALKGIESELGRGKSRRWGPRIIDIDILLYDDQIIDTPKLTIPHRDLHSRAFALVPLLEIAPELKNPASGIPFKTSLERLPEKKSIKVYNAPDFILRNR
jgi:2-amino-4-hydroxy-6-hydroxymethyldihydropteridine diphosphokinase